MATEKHLDKEEIRLSSMLGYNQQTMDQKRDVKTHTKETNLWPSRYDLNIHLLQVLRYLKKVWNPNGAGQKNKYYWYVYKNNLKEGDSIVNIDGCIRLSQSESGFNTKKLPNYH